jgi:hypothetical protein
VIRDNHPTSATLVLALLKAASQESGEDGLKETKAGRHSLVIAEADPLLSRLEEAAVLFHLQRGLNKKISSLVILFLFILSWSTYFWEKITIFSIKL